LETPKKGKKNFEKRLRVAEDTAAGTSESRAFSNEDEMKTLAFDMLQNVVRGEPSVQRGARSVILAG